MGTASGAERKNISFINEAYGKFYPENLEEVWEPGDRIHYLKYAGCVLAWGSAAGGVDGC